MTWTKPSPPSVSPTQTVIAGAIAVGAARATAVGDAGGGVATETAGETVGATTEASDEGWLAVGLQAARSVSPTSRSSFSKRYPSLFLGMCV
jgi:hypothetical protein